MEAFSDTVFIFSLSDQPIILANLEKKYWSDL
jgi:hypothetical protein